MSFYNSLQGDYNQHYSIGGLRDYDDTFKNKHYIRRALNKQYEDAIRADHRGTWEAHVLHASIEYEKSPQDVSISDHLNKKIRRIKVIAHVPDLDAALTMPEILGLTEDMNKTDEMRLIMHRVFYSRGHSKESVPNIGDRIEVDFEDKEAHTNGIYAGIIEKGIGSIPDHPDAQIASGKAQANFKDRQKKVRLLGSYTQPTQEEHQVFRQDEIARLIGVPSIALRGKV